MDVETIWENSMKHLQSDSSGGKKKKVEIFPQNH